MSEIKNGDVPITMQQRKSLLRKVCAVLNAHDIKFFLTCGTLLGYIRENNFIKWDRDIDIGIFDASEVFKLENQFEELGLKCDKHYARLSSLRLRISDNELDADSKLHVDFFEFEDTKEGIVFRFVYNKRYVEFMRSVIQTGFRILRKKNSTNAEGVIELLETSGLPSSWKRTLRRLCTWINKYQYKQGIHFFEPFGCIDVLWFGISVKIPSRPFDHLRLFYGDEWRIPNPNYSQSRERQRNIRRVEL